MVSRFKSAKDISDVQARVASGKVDILVGTHKLLQSDFRFEDLGLLIIDEEHRFGVKQKDAIKALRAEVDILAMTATPIPRTLNMALGGLRDLSIIATPPGEASVNKNLYSRAFDRARKRGGTSGNSPRRPGLLPA